MKLNLSASVMAGAGLALSPAMAMGQTKTKKKASKDLSKGTHLVLLGTQGGPIPNTERMMTAQAIMIDGKAYLIDCGYGALRRLYKMNISMADLKQVFITHQHADHIIDLPATWSQNVRGPIGIYGPDPMQKMYDGALQVYSEDYRIRGAGGRFAPIQEVFIPHTIENPNGEIVVVYEDDKVKVSTIDVPHSVMPLALAFRFDTAERSIVLSGDTSKSENVVKIAKGADVLVHEAMYWPGIIELLKKRGKGTISKEQENYFLNEHTTSEDAGSIATKAGVKTLVLSHLIAGPEGPTDKEWIEVTEKTFKGKIIVGRDLMVI